MRSDFDADAVHRAMAREGLAYLAHGLVYPLGRALRRQAPPKPRARETRTLVLVHGLGANPSSFLPLQAYLRLHGQHRFVSCHYRSRGSLEAAALCLKRLLDTRVRGGRIDLVAHSMGGLVARFYLQQLGGARRVDRLVTLGTPHQGTHAANFIPSALVRQLLPEGPFLRHLNALPPPAGVQVTSIVGGRDLLVQPVESARCPFGRVVRFEDLGHLELLFQPRVLAAVRASLVAPVPAQVPVGD